MTTQALAGVTVLEVSRLLPGALCTQMLADLGAEVIKVEQPGIGDQQRDFPPKAVRESGSFMLCNRNKRSITINFKHPEGKRVLVELAERADCLIEGFRPGVADRLGIGWTDVEKINPRLVYCALSGYGQTGPYARVPGHDANYLGLVGALQLSGRPETGPQLPGTLTADIGGGTLMAAFGILAALMARERTGRGQFVDVSMSDGMMSWMAAHAAEYLFAGREPRGGAYFNTGGAPAYNVYRCADGKHLTLGIIEDHFWRRLCDLIARPDLYPHALAEGETSARVQEELATVFLEKARDEWVRLLWERDIPAGPVNSFEEAFADPQMAARDMLQHVDHPSEGRVPQLGFPVKFSDTPGAIRRPPPCLGEHSDEILAELGYSKADVARLRKEGAI